MKENKFEERMEILFAKGWRARVITKDSEYDISGFAIQGDRVILYYEDKMIGVVPLKRIREVREGE